ncbi:MULTISPECIES: Spy/CpxP family protein refolding chaperone [Hyphomicrobiales]|uniref:Spy/CpxP family protein refolding chaperone n=2 Tax=Neoaquamicrobium sediminum TaxID=1849104 RepID=A0ABV3X146_9HYPH|nr:Spy/CpxP family protein refolding chaperone [Ciceribacter naphthalenivorans]MBX3584587.1 Spy/CpxP family protein refolding chaperone [Rhizobiaceae bacterium]SSC73145.1 unnamed protein product [Ciceribacter naphthalenivorans]SSX47259.1 unnamed protein product [Ciceribacter naphthalenivorans]
MTKILKTAFAAAMLLSASPALAEDAHHPAPAETTAPAPGEPAPHPSAPAPGGAEMPGGMMGGDMMKMMQEMMGRHAGMMRGMMADGAGMQDGMMGKMMAPEHVEGRIAFLRTELKVTDAQQPLWEAVAAALRENARGSTGMMQQEQDAQGLPNSLERREKLLSARLDAVRQLRAAVEPFYASLDEVQKAAADNLLMPMGMM